MDFQGKLNALKAELAAYPGVKLVIASKYYDLKETAELIAAGATALGENRIEVLRDKYRKFGNKVEWHFFGALQTRKVRDVLPMISCFHSLCRLSVAQEIEKRIAQSDNPERILDCFVEINLTENTGRAGVKLEKAKAFVEEIAYICPHIRIIGLMCIAKLTADTEVLYHDFRAVAALRDEIAALQIPNAPCTELSMGMTNDYKIALECGSTLIRIGRLFLM